jgi:hypothetical protein
VVIQPRQWLSLVPASEPLRLIPAPGTSVVTSLVLRLALLLIRCLYLWLLSGDRFLAQWQHPYCWQSRTAPKSSSSGLVFARASHLGYFGCRRLGPMCGSCAGSMGVHRNGVHQSPCCELYSVGYCKCDLVCGDKLDRRRAYTDRVGRSCRLFCLFIR